jgi:hypothetical protein
MTQGIRLARLKPSAAAARVSILLAAVSFAFLAINRVGLRYTPVLVPDPGNPNPLMLAPSYTVSTALGLSPLSVAVIGGIIALTGLILGALVPAQSLADKRLASFAIGLCSASILAGFLFAI